MKVLIYGINFSPELTGIGKYSGEMSRWLSERGHEVRVVTAPPYYPEWRIGKGYRGWKYIREIHFTATTSDQNRDGAIALYVYRCPLWVPAIPTGLKRILHLASFATSSLPLMLRQIFWRPEVVFVVEPPIFCAPIAWLVARLSSAKVWLHVQDFELDAAFNLGIIKSRWLKRFVCAGERWLLARFDRVSTISAKMLQALSTKGVPVSKQLLFPNWVGTDEIFPLDFPSRLRAEIGVEPHTLVALYSGNMGEKQGLEIVVEAARALNSHNNLKFVMCGNGSAYARLRTLAEDLPNMIWVPLQAPERLNELLNLADIHLLPQRADAADLVMPSKLTGMLASGRPIVATATKGTEIWSVVEGRGINVDPEDLNAFVDGIVSLAKDPLARSRFGQGARAYAEANLSRDRILGRVEMELTRLVGGEINQRAKLG